MASLGFSILLSWGCSFHFSSVLVWGGRGGFRILRIKVIVLGYLQPAACIKWRLEERALEVEGKHGGAGIWSLHSCEPKGKGWGGLYGKFFLLPCDLQAHFRDSLRVTMLEVVAGLQFFASLRSLFCGEPQLVGLVTTECVRKLICRGTKKVVNFWVAFTKC